MVSALAVQLRLGVDPANTLPQVIDAGPMVCGTPASAWDRVRICGKRSLNGDLAVPLRVGDVLIDVLAFEDIPYPARPYTSSMQVDSPFWHVMATLASIGRSEGDTPTSSASALSLSLVPRISIGAPSE